MRRFASSLVLSFILVTAGAVAPSWAEESGADVAQAIADARPAEPSTSKLDYLLELKKAVDEGLEQAGPLAESFPNVKAMAYLAALPLIPGGFAHADAINGRITEEMRIGFSLGVVLGADKVGKNYVKEHFVKWSYHDTVYPEHAGKFQQAYNGALIAGYTQGKNLANDEERTKAFWLDLLEHKDFDLKERFPSTPFKEWSDEDKNDYHRAFAVIFLRTHVKD